MNMLLPIIYKVILIVLCGILVLTGCNHSSPKNKPKPNVILINADDLGKGLLGYERQKYIKTPNIDRLAQEGMRFENFYAPMLCAPSRASLLTGYNDTRANGSKWTLTTGGIYKKISSDGWTPAEVQNKLDSVITYHPKETYLAEIFDQAGYVTGEVGKLGWGFATSFRQMHLHGWDYYYGYLDHDRAHGYYPPFLFENDSLFHIPSNTQSDCGVSMEPETPAAYKERWNRNGKAIYSEDLFMYKIKNFIRKNKDRPFFLYFPTQIPHGPVAIPAINPIYIHNDSLDDIEREYASMVTRLNSDVGTIMEELDRLNIAKNTIVIFMADNGHEIYYSKVGRVDKPYRNMKTGKLFNNITTKFYTDIGGDVFNGNDGMAGLKRSNWQGGVDVPFVIKWPGHIKKGTINHNLTAVFDLLPTFADLLDVKVSKKIDGKSFLSELLGQDSSQHRKYVAFSSFMGPALVTNEGWKLRNYAPDTLFQLYYLPDDYREENNVAAKHPLIVKWLKKILLEKCNGNLDNGWFKGSTHLKSVN